MKRNGERQKASKVTTKTPPKVETPKDGLTRLREECEELRHKKEAELLLKTLKASKWNLNETARAIGCAVSSLQRALARHPDIEAQRQKQAEAHGWIRRAA